MSRSTDRVLSRPIVLGWTLWLLASFTMNWLIDGPGTARVTAVAATPVVRWTMIMALVGLTIYWPLIRLSAVRDDDNIESVLALADLWGLLLVFQVIVWPARFLADWSITQTLMIDTAVIAHGAVIALWIMLGRRGGGVVRTVMMGVCLATLIVPAWFFTGRADETTLGFSPMRAVWVLTDHLPLIDAQAVLTRQLAVIAGALAFCGLLATTGIKRPQPNESSD